MKILILDDDKFRHDYFDRHYDGSEISHAYTYYGFFRLLQSGSPWDLIHLDHDLGDHETKADTYVDGWGMSREFTGQHAAQRICELDDDKLPKQVIIQSVNPVGAKRISQDLSSRGVPNVWEPFGESELLIS